MTAKEQMEELGKKILAEFPKAKISITCLMPGEGDFLGISQDTYFLNITLEKKEATARCGAEGCGVSLSLNPDRPCNLEDAFERVCELLKKTPTEHMTELKEKILAAVPDARVGLMPSFDAVICFLDIQHGKRFIEARYDFGGFGVCDCSTLAGISKEGPTERPADLEATAKRVLELLAKQEEPNNE